MTALPIAPDLLKLARTTLGLSQRDLAAELATHQTCIQAWESGRRAIPADHLPTLWAVLFPDAPGSAQPQADHTTQEAACADSPAPRSGALVSTADIAAQAEPGVTKRRGRPPTRFVPETPLAEQGWRPERVEIEIVCHLCGWDRARHPAEHRPLWVEAA